ncbi:unnamed protein product [Acidithrix sp. C25]|nr:unnamed protein product [Acidithrix sp. C25]
MLEEFGFLKRVGFVQEDADLMWRRCGASIEELMRSWDE